MAATDELIVREIRAKDERILQAVDRGGLPTEAEVDAVYEALGKAYDLVEELAVRVSGIAEIEDVVVSNDPPYTVTLAQIGLVAALASDLLDLELWQLRREAERLRAAIGPLDAVRRNQR